MNNDISAKKSSQTASKNADETGLIAHLGELRQRLLKCVVAVLLATMFTWSQTATVQSWFIVPIREVMKKYKIKSELVTSNPTEGFTTYFQISLISAVMLAMPVILYQLWRFIEPALTKNERRLTRAMVPFSTILFAMGVALGYYLSPLFFDFFLQFQPPGTSAFWSYATSIALMAKMLLVFGVCFQVPVITIFLAKTGVVSRNVMLEYWRHVVVVIFTIVAIITPTWDPITLCAAAVPPCVLYVTSLWMVKWL